MVEEENKQAKIQKGEQLVFYGFNSRMIPDDVHSKPVYRRLAHRTEEELKMIEKLKKKVEALNKKRQSRSVDPTKEKEESKLISEIEIRSEADALNENSFS
jgi:hypothetical protein